VGTFEIRRVVAVDGLGPFVIEGRHEAKGFMVNEPNAAFEFRDLTGMWRAPPLPLDDLQERPPHQIAVASGDRAMFAVRLPPSDFAAMALEWRLILRSAQNKQCSSSIPFRVLQQRGPVTGFVSASKPVWLKSDGKTQPCPCSNAVKSQLPEAIEPAKN